MTGSFIAAVNETLKKYMVGRSSLGSCYCPSPEPDVISECQNENLTRCSVSNLTDQNIVMLLNINCDFFNEYISLGPVVLKTLIDFFYISGEPRIITILSKHSQLHPGCAVSMRETYQELFCTLHDELGKRNLLDQILKVMEDGILTSCACVVNNRLSRERRRRKVFEDFITDQPTAEKSESEMVDVESTPIRWAEKGLYVLKYATEIMSHNFYSICAHRGHKSASNCIRETLVGKLFFDSTSDKIRLNDDTVMRLLEVYRNCDEKQRAIINGTIELLANCCWFIDSGKLTIDPSILSPKGYSVSNIFCQYFNQNVFKKVSDEDISSIIKPLNPNWLRLNAAQYALKRWQKRNVCGLQSVIPIFESAIRKLYKQETSRVLKDLNVDSQNGEFSNQIPDELLSACTSNDVATLRKLSKTGDIDFQATDQSGCTILHLVAKYGSADCAEFLLGSDTKIANIDVEDGKGVTPMSYVLQNYNTRLFDLFLKHGATLPADCILGITELDSTTYDFIFYKKLEPELCKILLITVDSFISCFHLREIIKLNGEYKKRDVTTDPSEGIDYKFYEQAIRDYYSLKNVIEKVTCIKDCPTHVDVFKFL